MANRRNADRNAGSWRDWAAGHIQDPLLRLRFLQAVAPAPESPTKRAAYSKTLACLLCLLAVPVSLLLGRGLRSWMPPPAAPSRPPLPVAPAAPRGDSGLPPAPVVWLVEQTAAYETFSNGLRIDDRFLVANHRRSYVARPVDGSEGEAGTRRGDPAGIVFHTTESLQVPFEPDRNSQLKRVGESVLDFVARRRAYHFLIDRFGRVFRVVAETDAANHAGNSVWSDGRWVYLNLNESFLGVSFEARTGPDHGGAPINRAQVRAAAMLTEMLRSRYAIAARDCVTHAQVSVNPSLMLAGYHTDWASGFPFGQIGLPDNYAVPLPAIALFGFHYDAHFAGLAASSLYPGVAGGEDAFRGRREGADESRCLPSGAAGPVSPAESRGAPGQPRRRPGSRRRVTRRASRRAEDFRLPPGVKSVVVPAQASSGGA